MRHYFAVGAPITKLGCVLTVFGVGRPSLAVAAGAVCRFSCCPLGFLTVRRFDRTTPMATAGVLGRQGAPRNNIGRLSPPHSGEGAAHVLVLPEALQVHAALCGER